MNYTSNVYHALSCTQASFLKAFETSDFVVALA